MKFKRQKDTPTTTNYPPTVVTSDPLASRGTPLPPVSEYGTLPTDSLPRPPPAMSVPQFSFTNMSHPHGTTTMPPFSSSSAAPSLGGSTQIDMERIMKQDEAAMNDFVPPRQAMNSDESDFDWDEDINLGPAGQFKKKNKSRNSKWRKLSPFLRMTIMILIGCPIVALPAILVQQLMADDPPLPEITDPPTPHPAVPKDTITLIFVWLSFMWGIVFLTNWGVDVVPMVVVRFSSFVSSSRLEIVKSRMMIFVATKKYLKFLLASCWSIGSFAFLSTAIYPRTNEKLNPVFVEVLGTIVAGCALVLVEKILLQMISTNFHQTAYADRITENKYALSVLDRLSTSKKYVKKVRPTHSRHNTDTGDYHFSIHRSSIPTRSNSLEGHGSNGNGSPTHATGNFIHDGHGIDTEAEILSDSLSDAPIKLAEVMTTTTTPATTPTEAKDSNRNSAFMSAERQRHHRGQRPKQNENIFRGINRRLHGIALANKSSPSKDIGSAANAKRLAKTLFYNLQTNSDELVVQNFYPYFDSHEEAQRAFSLFDKDANGDISKSEMKEKIFYVYKERKDLHTSLRDLSQAAGKLDIIFLTIVALLWIFIVLSIFGKDIVKNMLSIGSFLVALSFVFGNSLKILFENIVFLFVTHPYDSGDLVCIDDTDMYVREVGLNSTTFVTWDGKRMYYPNNIISQKPIHNVRRSPNMTDKIVLHIDCYTPQVKIFELRARMRDYLMKESKEFQPGLEIQIQEMDARLKISMCIEHKGNWQDSGRRWARRTAFNYALKEAVEDIGIRYYAVPQRVEVYNRENQEIDQYHIRGQEQDTLSPNSPLRQYSPEHVARLYRRPTINRPAEGGGGAE